MLAYTLIILFISMSKCSAYDNQWVPSFYFGTFSQRFQTLTMSRGSCIISLNIFKSKHFNVDIPLTNGSIPAGFCAILLNSMESFNLAIALEQGYTDTNNYLFNENIKLIKTKNGNIELIHE